MMVVSETNVNTAFPHVLRKLLLTGETADSRNGRVSFVSPFMLEIHSPEQRVLFDKVRQPNPFFHVAEFVWMMAGSRDVAWIEFFNSRMRKFADDDSSIHHGAYGHRWQHHFDVNQIIAVRDLLVRDPNTRRAVIGMWDPRTDLEEHNDLPCNTHIYFRVNKNRLDMTVCNRSNDLIWGMLGANIVHMTLLQELLARDLCLHTGVYRVFTNNLHIYHSVPKFEKYLECRHDQWLHGSNYYAHSALRQGRITPYPLLDVDETLEEFLDACCGLVAGGIRGGIAWVNKVAIPMLAIYEDRKGKVKTGRERLHEIVAPDWRLAAQEWIEAKELVPSNAEV